MVMTPIILDRLRKLEEYLKILRQLAAHSREQITGDPVLLGSVERYLQVAIEACLDIANHLISMQRLKSPETYAEAFRSLQDSGILPPEFAADMQAMARFRNRLVRLYWEI